MRLATFTDEFSGSRFGIVRGEQIVDVVAAADALRHPVPATSVKAALTSGPQTLAALQALVELAESHGLHRAVVGVKFCRRFPILQNSSASARTTRNIARNSKPTRC